MKHELINHRDSIDIIINKLKKKEAFTFVRFGDGDYIIMYNESIGQIVGGGNQFFITKKLQEELIECHNIEDKNFLIATIVNDLSIRSNFEYVDEGKLPNLRQRDKMLIFGCLMDIFIDDIEKFKEFSHEMCKTSTMFVCGYNHPNLEKVYGEIKHYVKIPQQNSYANIDTWYKEILMNLDKVDKVVLSAGFSSRIIAKRLWETSKEITVIDVGSLSDMLIMNTEISSTIPSRKWIKSNPTGILHNLGELLGEEII